MSVLLISIVISVAVECIVAFGSVSEISIQYFLGRLFRLDIAT